MEDVELVVDIVAEELSTTGFLVTMGRGRRGPSNKNCGDWMSPKLLRVGASVSSRAVSGSAVQVWKVSIRLISKPSAVPLPKQHESTAHLNLCTPGAQENARTCTHHCVHEPGSLTMMTATTFNSITNTHTHTKKK